MRRGEHRAECFWKLSRRSASSCEHQADVTLMDLRLPDSSGIEATIAIRKHFAEARVILLSTFERDVEIKRALEAGAWGYVLKPPIHEK